MGRRSLWFVTTGLVVAGGMFCIFLQKPPRPHEPQPAESRLRSLPATDVPIVPPPAPSTPPWPPSRQATVPVEPPRDTSAVAESSARRTPVFPPAPQGTSATRSWLEVGAPAFTNPLQCPPTQPPSAAETACAGGVSLLVEHAGGDQGLASLLKKPEEGKPMALSVNDTSDIGVQYSLVKIPDTALLLQVSGGYSQDYPGLSQGKGVPEMLLGCQFEQQLYRRNKVLGAVEYGCDPSEIGLHRVRTKATWEMPLASGDRLNLHTSVIAASSYAPLGEQAKNLNYALDLVWKY